VSRAPKYVILLSMLLGFVAGAWSDNWATFRACSTKGSATVWGGTMQCHPDEPVGAERKAP
jgi:hypothetical protein